MLGASLRFGRSHPDDRFYCPPKARRNHYNQQNEQRYRNKSSGNGAAAGSVSSAQVSKGKALVSDDQEPENRTAYEEISKPEALPAEAVTVATPSNLERFLDSTTPSVPAQYLSKTTMRGWRTCDVEFQPYFALVDLWESFKEWSAYGAGVPLILDESDSVVQYYVPYLSGIQLYGERTRQPVNSRRPGEDSDVDNYRDSSSDGSSDSELDRGTTYSRECRHYPDSASMLRMDRLSFGDRHDALMEGFSSDDSEAGNSQGHLLFEFLERDVPYSRVPFADKIADLSCRFPELKTLRSCDLLPSSWISVAWYPIYRIPTGPTLRDWDACFLTFHSLSTPVGGVNSSPGPIISYPQRPEGVPEISIPVFGLATYKFKGSIWTPNGGCQRQHASSLQQAADNWLRLLNVNHPDYQFFISNGFRR